MSAMNRYYKIFGLHVMFAFLVVGVIAADVTFTIFKAHLTLAIPLVVFGLPWLTLLSWRGANDAPSEWFRNYFKAFRWVSLMFWAAQLILAWAFIQLAHMVSAPR